MARWTDDELATLKRHAAMPVSGWVGRAAAELPRHTRLAIRDKIATLRRRGEIADTTARPGYGEKPLPKAGIYHGLRR